MIENTILLLSKRTVSKILSRANCSCSLCNWNEAHCDIHHIVPKKKGGKDTMDNLICVCPNCHRKLHQYGEKFKTVSELKEKSLEKTLPNWKDFYNPTPAASAKICIKNGINYFDKECAICKNKIASHLTYCSEECKFQGRKKFDVSKEELEHLVATMPFVKIAKLYNVCDNTIRDRCRKLEIKIPKYPKGYWLKREE